MSDLCRQFSCEALADGYWWTVVVPDVTWSCWVLQELPSDGKFFRWRLMAEPVARLMSPQCPPYTDTPYWMDSAACAVRLALASLATRRAVRDLMRIQGVRTPEEFFGDWMSDLAVETECGVNWFDQGQVLLQILRIGEDDLVRKYR